MSPHCYLQGFQSRSLSSHRKARLRCIGKYEVCLSLTHRLPQRTPPHNTLFLATAVLRLLFEDCPWMLAMGGLDPPRMDSRVLPTQLCFSRKSLLRFEQVSHSSKICWDLLIFRFEHLHKALMRPLRTGYIQGVRPRWGSSFQTQCVTGLLVCTLERT